MENIGRSRDGLVLADRGNNFIMLRRKLLVYNYCSKTDEDMVLLEEWDYTVVNRLLLVNRSLLNVDLIIFDLGRLSI